MSNYIFKSKNDISIKNDMINAFKDIENKLDKKFSIKESINYPTMQPAIKYLKLNMNLLNKENIYNSQKYQIK